MKNKEEGRGTVMIAPAAAVIISVWNSTNGANTTKIVDDDLTEIVYTNIGWFFFSFRFNTHKYSSV